MDFSQLNGQLVLCRCYAVEDIPRPDIMEAICVTRSSSLGTDNVETVRSSCSILDKDNVALAILQFEVNE